MRTPQERMQALLHQNNPQYAAVSFFLSANDGQLPSQRHRHNHWPHRPQIRLMKTFCICANYVLSCNRLFWNYRDFANRSINDIVSRRRRRRGNVNGLRPRS